ncbi:hypothetical protein [Raineyella fluvialis]|uniref:DUF4153 domain-containing protein n=1 Tax=Raineyella fluvialis TaxID=2662261 RepID=A0A5Q2F8G6_9ACTN|nr:hypothetical protein [Raineyella fluvialis]QGF22958.1 hypothetical protein Rai3103_03950 [Raineyella fluvialis]
MPVEPPTPHLEAWRSYLHARAGVSDADADALTGQLVDVVGQLGQAGLSADEAFLVAVKRLGGRDARIRGFGRELPGLLWEGTGPGSRRSGAAVAVGFAVLAGLAVRVPFLVASAPPGSAPGAATAAVLGVAVVLGAYLAVVRRRFVPGVVATGLGIVVLLGLVQALYPFAPRGQTQTLFLLHLPIVLWLVLGAVYLGPGWRAPERWIEVVRFTGESIIHFVLIALGGGVLLGLANGMFRVAGIEAMTVLDSWVLPLGVGGAVVIAAWLVEAGKSVTGSLAAVLTRIFTPLFTVFLLAFLVAVLWTGQSLRADRDLLILMDVLLAVVLGLVVFSLSSRPSAAAPDWTDRWRLVLLVSALAVDVLVLLAIGARIAEWGASPNRLAAAGENVVLAINLSGAAWLQLGFLRGKRSFTSLVGWQCRYLPVLGVWAAVVAVGFGPLFGYL